MLNLDKKSLKQNIISVLSLGIYRIVSRSFDTTKAELYEFLTNPPENFPKDFLNYLANTCLSDSFSTFKSSILYAIDSIKVYGYADYYTFVFNVILYITLIKLELRSFFISKLFKKKFYCPYCRNELKFELIFNGHFVCGKCGNSIA